MPTLTIRHVTTYRYRQPVAFGEHRMMLRPRDSHDQRVIETSLEISPQPASLRFVEDAFGNHVAIARFSGRARGLRFESIVCLEHSPRAGADLDLDDDAPAFPVDYSDDEMPDLALYIERHHPDPEQRGRPLGPPVPAGGRVDRHFRASHPAVAGHPSGLPLPAARSEGHPAAGRDAAARPRQLPRFRHADDRGGALARSRRALCVRLSRRAARRSERAGRRLAHGSTHAWAQVYLPGTGWIDFDPTSGSVGKTAWSPSRSCAIRSHATPLHGTFIGFPVGPSRHGGAGEHHLRAAGGEPGHALQARPMRRSGLIDAGARTR